MIEEHRFGHFELRPGQRCLLANGRPVPLGGRALDLLAALARRQGQVVSRGELYDAVWPGVAVEENNLAVQVLALRKVLGAQAIVTVPGRGYQLALQPGVPPAAQAAFLATSLVTGLPPLGQALLGRDTELTDLCAMLEQQHLITVLGAGGMGKTSLALAAACRCEHLWRDGVAWVEFAGVADPALVASTVARAMRVPASSDADPVLTLAAALTQKQLLLVLDNVEHLLAAVARLADALVRTAPGLHLLVTSQAPLKVADEHLFRLGPLSVPAYDPPPAEALQYGAVALFAERAGASDQTFELTAANVGAVVGICHRLEGLPLALKLAAARMPLLGASGLHARLMRGTAILAEARDSAALPRQRTLRAALGWSYGLLSPAVQTLFRRLSVFAGGFSLDAAILLAQGEREGMDEMAAVEALSELIDRSMVVASQAEPPRYRLLEGVRDHARLLLARNGETQAVRRQHALAILEVFKRAKQDYLTTEDSRWVAAYGADLDNLRAALDWCAHAEPGLAVQLLAHSGFLFFSIGLIQEFRDRCANAEAAAALLPDSVVVADFWLHRSLSMAWCAHRLMHDWALRASEIYRRAGDRLGLYLALCFVTGSGRPATARLEPLLHEIRGLEDPEWPASLRLHRCWVEDIVHFLLGRPELARQVAVSALRQAEQSGHTIMANAFVTRIAMIELVLGHTEAAIARSREAIARERALGIRQPVQPLGHLARALLAKHAFAEAREVMADFLQCCRAERWVGLPMFSDLLAKLALGEGRPRSAACLVGYADAAWRGIGTPVRAGARFRVHAVRELSAALGAELLEQLMAIGASMTEIEACACTLGNTDLA